VPAARAEGRDEGASRPRGRRWRRRVLFVLFQAAATLLLCEAALRLVTTTNPENRMPMVGRFVLLPHRPAAPAVREWLARAPAGYLAPDRELGWTVKPNGRSPDGLYEANAQGARAPASRAYGGRPEEGRLRVVTVGDSFTHGDEVGLEDTWQRELERRRGDLEVVNLGVPGYGTDQAYLRWRREGAALRPDFALLGIWPENVCRNLNVVRFFLQPVGGFGFMSKPRFVVEEGGLRAVNEPVIEGEALVRALTEPGSEPLMRHDYWAIARDYEPRGWHRLRTARVAATVASLYRRRAMRDRLYAGVDPRGNDVTAAIAEAFHRDAERAGAVPLVVVIPMVDLLSRYPDEGDLPLAKALRARGRDVIDLGPPMARAVREEGRACCYLDSGHLSPAGNRRLAGWLLERLAPRLPAPHP
jgi:hypothetical protein